MDPFSDALDGIRFQGIVYCLSEFSAPWGLQMPSREGHVSFFMLLRGNCVVSFEGQEKPLSMAGGELVLSPRGSACVIQDHIDSSLVPMEQAFTAPHMRGSIVKYGGGGAVTSLMLGCFVLDSDKRNPLVAGLPNFIHLRTDDLQSEPWLETSLRQLASEASQNRPGSDVLSSRLTDIVFVQTIRAFMGQIRNCPETTGWFKGLIDKEVGASLKLIHEKPEAPWTVAQLAHEVGMSRTSFSVKFSQLMNCSPIEYLTMWRMQLAIRMIERGESNANEIAAKTGYTAEAAFAKAFKREMGITPAGYRKNLQLSGIAISE